MDLSLTDEQSMIVDIVRRFVSEQIVPLEAGLDPDADELPQADYQRLVATTQAMGLYGLDTPPGAISTVPRAPPPSTAGRPPSAEARHRDGRSP